MVAVNSKSQFKQNKWTGRKKTTSRKWAKLWAERSTLSSSINFHTKHNVVDTVEWGHCEPSKNQQI